MRKVDTVVVGAGLSGLVAATRLSRAGRRVLCLEARPRAGGRALSLPTRAGPVDLGATWFWPGEAELEALVRSIGVSTFAQHIAGDVLLEPNELVHPTAPSGEAAVQRVRGNPVDVPAYRFANGVGDLVARTAGQLPAEVLRLETPVVSVAETVDGVIVRSATTDQELSTVTADHVILALPPSLAVATIDFTATLDPHVAAIATRTAVWMGEAVKAVAVYQTPFWREQGLAGAAVSYRGPFREFHDMSGADGDPPALFGFAPAAELTHRTRQQIQFAYLDQLVRLFGPQAAKPVAVHAKDWSQERWTTPPPGPGPLATTAGFGHPIYGAANPSDSILWASTETSELHPGHLDGAVHAGMRAARTILGAPIARGGPSGTGVDDAGDAR